ncbi:MAG: ROK family protein [Bowdeniella nasicola]|nr:ROK family protein [Bowdeniella nasicola]
MAQSTTLAIDCGGGGIKASVLGDDGVMHAQPVRTVTPYPLSPARLVTIICELADQLPPAARLTVGMPGMIRRGVVVYTPHYICKAGPRTRIDPALETAWSGFDIQTALTEALNVPALVLNDAEVHACGVVIGTGLEVVLTLGTGVGNAIFDAGVLQAHAELSAAPLKWGLTYDDYLGEHERLRLGDAHWSRRVRQVVEALEPVFHWDRLYLGGGNARRITPTNAARLGRKTMIIPNAAGISGGVRAWQLCNQPASSHLNAGCET